MAFPRRVEVKSEDISIPPVRDDGLQLEERRDIQRVFWTVQRVSWAFFGLICLIALLGFTGSGGMFQKQKVFFADAEVELPRITRWEGSDGLRVRFTSAGVKPEILIAQPFFDLFSIERIQPEPQENALASAGQRMTFVAEGAPPHEVSISIRSMHFGRAKFDMTVGGETQTVNILVLP
ncbi:hypothetical protein [Falsirhodobacter sp. 1013]|uniref:hypothetical protein n=1 Tax=Falsirhodobacter sp. 1013 TaxID=3417566 RepID=UPI003EBCEF2E